MLVGTILTVSWHDVLQLAAIVLAVGIIHWLARKKLFMISEDPGKAAQQRLRMWWWDVVFYATFGVVVTSSVKVAGVLLIFSLLIIPAVTAMISLKGTIKRVVFGWAFGLIGCVLGLEFSLRGDFAAGPSIIATLLGLLLICTACVSLVKRLRINPKRDNELRA
jgi:zinc/manganese transport system permease protein